jgi:hypothetical protein
MVAATCNPMTALVANALKLFAHNNLAEPIDVTIKA